MADRDELDDIYDQFFGELDAEDSEATDEVDDDETDDVDESEPEPDEGDGDDTDLTDEDGDSDDVDDSDEPDGDEDESDDADADESEEGENAEDEDTTEVSAEADSTFDPEKFSAQTLTLKVAGQEVEMTGEQVLQAASKGLGAELRFQEAAEYRKEVEPHVAFSEYVSGLFYPPEDADTRQVATAQAAYVGGLLEEAADPWEIVKHGIYKVAEQGKLPKQVADALGIGDAEVTGFKTQTELTRLQAEEYQRSQYETVEQQRAAADEQLRRDVTAMWEDAGLADADPEVKVEYAEAVLAYKAEHGIDSLQRAQVQMERSRFEAQQAAAQAARTKAEQSKGAKRKLNGASAKGTRRTAPANESLTPEEEEDRIADQLMEKLASL